MILGRINNHFVDTGMTRTTLNLLYNRLDRSKLALQQEFYSSVGEVARVPAKPVHAGSVAGEIAETDALHPATDSSPDTMHLAWL